MASEGNSTAALRLVATGARAGLHMPTAGERDIEPRHDCVTPLGEMFAAVAADREAAPAFTTTASRWSYRELLNAARAVAGSVSAHPAFAPGECVVLLLPNSPEYAAAFYGVLLAGGVVVPLSPRIEQGKLERIVESTEAGLMLAPEWLTSARADLRARPAREIPCDPGAQELRGPSGDGEGAHLRCTADDACGLRRSERPALPRSTGELAAILYTAGSSGVPKGVMLSHENLIANARSIQQYLEITNADRPLCVLPFHHAFGNSVLQSHLLAGAHLVIDGQTLFPETLVEALARHECTSLSGVPDLFRMLLERTSLGRRALPRLRSMAVAGGPLRRDAALEVARRIAPARLFVMYGQTEATARLAYIPPEQLAELPEGAIGRGIPGVALQVVDEQDLPVAAGAVGELRANGPGIMLGYWRDPAGTEERVRKGWLYTGDLATIDAAGTIVLKGRRNALVKIAGHRVHPADLEEFAMRRLSFAEAVAVSYEAPDVGQRLALFLRGRGAAAGLASSQILARCRAELPAWMVPDLVQIVDVFPLTDSLKVDRPRLSYLAEQEAARRRTPA